MTDLRALLGDRYGIRTPAQLAHVLSEKLDDAAPLNVTRRWLPLAEELWERISLPDLLADAWEEGHADGLHNAHEHREHRKMRNPYRPEAITRDATGAPVTLAAPDAIKSNEQGSE